MTSEWWLVFRVRVHRAEMEDRRSKVATILFDWLAAILVFKKIRKDDDHGREISEVSGTPGASS